jgi:flagellar basal body-associated protein FliL
LAELKKMKKNMYLWILIVLAIILCGALLIVASNMPKQDYGINTSVKNESSSSKNASEKSTQSIENVDLTQENIDFEEDAGDLADDFIDDTSFDIEPELDSIENEVN